MNRQESLRLSGGFESAHLSLALSGRLVRHLSPIVGIAISVVGDRRHDGPVRCAVTSQLIRYQPPGFACLTVQQPAKEAFGRTLIATGLNKNTDHVAVLVNGAPEILLLTLDIHEEFIQMPNVTQSALSSSESPGIFGPELPTPLSDGLVADYDPALCQEVFNVSEAQAESVVEPNGMTYDLRWESISAIAGCLRIHQPSLHVSPQLDNTAGSVGCGFLLYLPSVSLLGWLIFGKK